MDHPPFLAALLPWFLVRGISANAVSIGGSGPRSACGACLSPTGIVAVCLRRIAPLHGLVVADGLDGMVARATGTASPSDDFSRLCDHGVFSLI